MNVPQCRLFQAALRGAALELAPFGALVMLALAAVVGLAAG